MILKRYKTYKLLLTYLVRILPAKSQQQQSYLPYMVNQYKMRFESKNFLFLQ